MVPVTDKFPQRIRQAFVRAGYVNPRTDEPSVRALAVELGLNNATVSRYFHQQSRMKLETRTKVAEALGLDVTEMDDLVHGQRTAPYTPPESAHTLSFQNRRLVDQLINALAGADSEEVGDHAKRSAPMSEEAASHAEQYGLAAHPDDDVIADDQLPEEGP